MFDLSAFLEKYKVVRSKQGDEWSLQCTCDVSRQSASAHLSVNVTKDVGFCFRCGQSYNLIALIRYVAGCTHAEAHEIIREQCTPKNRLRLARQALEPTVFDATDTDDAIPTVQLPREMHCVTSERDLPAYLRTRRVTVKQCLAMGIGWCESGFYAGRVIIPIPDVYGRLVSFGARLMGASASSPKMLYPKGSRTSYVLFGHRAALPRKRIVVVEGIFDALRVGTGGLALNGKIASKEQISHLVDLGMTRRIIVMLDRDAYKETYHLAFRLADVCPDVRVAMIPPGAKDPGECSRAALKNAIISAVRLRDARLSLERACAKMQ